MIRKHIGKLKDGHYLKVWHEDNRAGWVKFRRLPDIDYARARIKSATMMLQEGSFTDDAKYTVARLISLKLCPGGVELIGKTISLKCLREIDKKGSLMPLTHRNLDTAMATGRGIQAILRDGRSRRVQTAVMMPTELGSRLHYIGGVLYYQDETKEPLGYKIINGILNLYYIGEQYAK